MCITTFFIKQKRVIDSFFFSETISAFLGSKLHCPLIDHAMVKGKTQKKKSMNFSQSLFTKKKKKKKLALNIHH